MKRRFAFNIIPPPSLKQQLKPYSFPPQLVKRKTGSHEPVLPLPFASEGITFRLAAAVSLLTIAANRNLLRAAAMFFIKHTVVNTTMNICFVFHLITSTLSVARQASIIHKEAVPKNKRSAPPAPQTPKLKNARLQS